jgi:hypothetical protein
MWEEMRDAALDPHDRDGCFIGRRLRVGQQQSEPDSFRDARSDGDSNLHPNIGANTGADAYPYTDADATPHGCSRRPGVHEDL